VVAKLHPLKRYRKKHKISANGMAKMVDMTRASIERIERYQQLPSMGAVTKFIKVTGLRADDFLPPKGAT
jgi:DNA-binding XRE family transcriptional regulator